MGEPGGASAKDKSKAAAAFVDYAMSDEHKNLLKPERDETGDTSTIIFKNISIVNPDTKEITHYDEIKITAKNKKLKSEQILFSSLGEEAEEVFVSCTKKNKKGESSFINSKNNKDKCDVVIKGLRAAVLRSDMSRKDPEKRGIVTNSLFKWAVENKSAAPSLVDNCSEALDLSRKIARLERDALTTKKHSQDQVDINSLRKKRILITVAVAIGAAILIAGAVTACVFFPPLIAIISLGLPVVAGVAAAIREVAAGNRVTPAAIYKSVFDGIKDSVKWIWDYNTCSKEKAENIKTADRLAEVAYELKESEKIDIPNKQVANQAVASLQIKSAVAPIIDELKAAAAFDDYAMSDEHKNLLKPERDEAGDTSTIIFKNISIFNPDTKEITHYDEIKITARNKKLKSEQILFSSLGEEAEEVFVSCTKKNKQGESSFINSKNNKDKCDVVIKGLRAAVLRSDMSRKDPEKRGIVTNSLLENPSLVDNCSKALKLAQKIASLEHEALTNHKKVDIKSLRKKHILITVAVAIGAAILIAGVVTACVFFPPLIPIIAVGLPVVAGAVAAIRERAAGNRVAPAAIYKGLFHAIMKFIKGVWDYNTCSKEKAENIKTEKRLAEVTALLGQLKEPEKNDTPINIEKRLGVGTEQKKQVVASQAVAIEGNKAPKDSLQIKPTVALITDAIDGDSPKKPRAQSRIA